MISISIFVLSFINKIIFAYFLNIMTSFHTGCDKVDIKEHLTTARGYHLQETKHLIGAPEPCNSHTTHTITPPEIRHKGFFHCCFQILLTGS